MSSIKLTTLKSVFIGFIICLWSVTSSAEIFYKVTHDNKTIWLMGTLHAAKKDAIEISNAAKQALKASDEVWFEADPEQLKKAQAIVRKYAHRDDGKLSQQVDADTWQQLTDIAAQYDVPAQALEPLNAWFAQVIIVARAIANSGYSEAAGVEAKLTALAKASNKDIKGLETVERQIKALVAAQSASGEDELLEQTIAEVHKVEETFDDIQQTWKAGDLAKLTDFLNQSLPQQAMDELIIKRNNEWLQRLEQQPDVQQWFVAVGAGHLGGDHGLLNQLRQRGAEVTRVLSK